MPPGNPPDMPRCCSWLFPTLISQVPESWGWGGPGLGEVTAAVNSVETGTMTRKAARVRMQNDRAAGDQPDE